MEIRQYSVVVLKDNKTACIIEMFGDDYIADIGDNPKDWETICIRKEDIKEVLEY